MVTHSSTKPRQSKYTYNRCFQPPHMDELYMCQTSRPAQSQRARARIVRLEMMRAPLGAIDLRHGKPFASKARMLSWKRRKVRQERAN
jgi:hypothetical protein